jgi:hypothetical protein
MMGSQKVPRMVVLHCNGTIYGNAYLITYKVESLHAYTLAPMILPLLEALVEGFFWNLWRSVIAFDLISSFIAKCVPLRPVSE